MVGHLLPTGPEESGAELRREPLDNVFRTYARVVLDLLAATEPGDGDGGVAALADGGEEALFADRAGHVIVLHFVAERTGQGTRDRVRDTCGGASVRPEGAPDCSHGWSPAQPDGTRGVWRQE